MTPEESFSAVKRGSLIMIQYPDRVKAEKMRWHFYYLARKEGIKISVSVFANGQLTIRQRPNREGKFLHAEVCQDNT